MTPGIFTTSKTSFQNWFIQRQNKDAEKASPEPIYYGVVQASAERKDDSLYVSLRLGEADEKTPDELSEIALFFDYAEWMAFRAFIDTHFEEWHKGR